MTHRKKCSEKGKVPTHEHHHEIYDKPKFGRSDEGHTIKDYKVLRKHLKNPKSKKLITNIIKEESEHEVMFGKVEKLECQHKRRKSL